MYAQLSLVVEPQPKFGFYLHASLACQTFILPKGEEKSGNLPIPFWFISITDSIFELEFLSPGVRGHAKLLSSKV